MKCGYSKCIYNNPTRVELDNNFVQLSPCKFCNDVYYHSEQCILEDWEMGHKSKCQKNKQNQQKSNNQQTSQLNKYNILLSEDKCLGRGAYGYVTKVEEKSTRKIKAMKVINKKFISKHGSDTILTREVEIQKKLLHKNVIGLHDFFEDQINYYLILEYAKNGNLYKYQKRMHKGKFSEKDAYYLFLQTCVGVEFLHNNNIIHRDQKPENLLLDENYNVKLCDFGWSVEIQQRDRTTFCGTVDYMAPEICSSEKYGKAVDNWALGILQYELIHGYPPYSGGTENERMGKIKHCAPIKFEAGISEEAKDLIQKLLKKNPYERLSIRDILKHPWLSNFNKRYSKSSSMDQNSNRNTNNKISAKTDSDLYMNSYEKFGNTNVKTNQYMQNDFNEKKTVSPFNGYTYSNNQGQKRKILTNKKADTHENKFRPEKKVNFWNKLGLFCCTNREE